MSENKTTYESLDGKIAPEALLKDTRGKLQMVDGHGIKQEADYDDPDTKVSSVCGCYSDREGI